MPAYLGNTAARIEQTVCDSHLRPQHARCYLLPARGFTCTRSCCACHFLLVALLLGNSRIGACNVVWRQQQRPDKSGKSDRNHRAAKGVYMWWEGCNKLALSYLDGVEDAEVSQI